MGFCGGRGCWFVCFLVGWYLGFDLAFFGVCWFFCFFFCRVGGGWGVGGVSMIRNV